MLLEVKNLRTGYHKKEIVHGVSFGAEAGEFVCIVGSNGCGKTTTLKSILGLLKPFAGEVRVDGKDTLSMTDKERAKYFAYIPQAHTPPFPFTVADVVIMGRTPYINTLARVTAEDRRIAYQALELLGIQSIAERTYTHLSGGQQQLVLIARALAQEPRVLIMDEPTASLDFGNQQLVLRQMKTLSQTGTTVLMVTHDPDHALVCADRVIAMQKGEIIGNGAPLDVLTDACLRTIYGIEASIVSIEVRPGVIREVCAAV